MAKNRDRKKENNEEQQAGMGRELTGRLVKGIGGFYYVKTADGVYECKAKGILRKDGKKPLVGDTVAIEVLNEEAMLGNLCDVLPRKNELLRPAVANIDQALIIFAITNPHPPLNLIDRMLILMEQQGLPCAVVFNKSDLDEKGEGDRLRRIYESAGYRVFVISAAEQKGLDDLKAFLKGRTTTVSGPSGVGKSSLINLLAGREVMETGEISEKIDRGKHTTRHSELFSLWDEDTENRQAPDDMKETADDIKEAADDMKETADDMKGTADDMKETVADMRETYICDTPGFSSLELYMAGIEKEDLWKCYPEFIPEEPKCRFAGCSHVAEPGCGVKEAVSEGRISDVRYENYCQLYEGLKVRRKY